MDEVGAKNKNKEKKSENSIVNVEMHIGVFFDGTNNNANVNKALDWLKLSYYVERSQSMENRIVLDRLRKNSNPAILSSLFYSGSQNAGVGDNGSVEKYLKVYVEGSGTNGFHSENEALEIAMHHGKPLKGLGFGVGSTGVVAKVSKAVKYISERIDSEKDNHFATIKGIHFYVFGFSRGSACARLFSYLVARSAGDPVGVLDREKEFDKYLTKKYFKKGKVCFLENCHCTKTVDFLGIYDTVSAIGFLKDKDDSVSGMRYAFMGDADFWGNFHKDNAKEYGLYSPSLPSVLSTCHICALDEYRANFALTDIGNSTPKNSLELYIPGCHSDIGGGYTPEGSEIKVEKKAILKEVEKKKTRIKSNGVWCLVSKPLLMEMGWGDDSEIDEYSEVRIDFGPEMIIGRGGGVTISHAPQPKEVYSNITLRFMYERAVLKAPKLAVLFQKLSDADYPVPSDDALGKMWKVLQQKKDSDGKVVFNFTPEEYRHVRMNYLHFTSTDIMYGLGDVGNVPGRDNSMEFSDIKRLLYHGGQNDSSDIEYLHDKV